MKVFLPNDEIDEQVKKLIRSFRKQMDGDVSEQMEKRGVSYRLNFGINLVSLRERAKTLPQNIEFADRLWHRQIRETMILATLSAPKEQMTAEMATEWSELIDNCELVEQAALNLFSKIESASTLVEKWIISENPYLRSLAYYTLGWMFRFNDVSEELKNIAIKKASEETGEDNVFCLYRGITHFMKQMMRINPETKKECKDLIKVYETKQNKNLSWVTSELNNEIEFL